MRVDDLWNRILQEASGDLNRWYAGEKLKHNPDTVEALRYFLDNGGEKYCQTALAREKWARQET